MAENNQIPPGMGGNMGATTGTGTSQSGRVTTGDTGTVGSTGTGLGGGATISGGGTSADAGRFDRAREYAQQKYQAASSAVRDQYTAVRQRVDEVDMSEVTGKARDYVRANPGKALLFSVAVGFVVGLLFRQSDED